MMGPTHAATGAAAWVVLGPLAGVAPVAVAVTIPIAALAALCPDIDHPRATISRVLPFIGWPIQKITQHRVQTHSVLIGLLMVGMLYPVAGRATTAAVAVGWLIGHIGADCLTVEGCAIIWPISRRKTQIGFMVTGGLGERIYTLLLTPLVVLYYLAAIRGGWL